MSTDLSTEDILYTDEAKARLGELEALRDDAGTDEEREDWDAEYADEYNTLVEFRDAVDREWPGAWDAGISLVRDSYWQDYTADQARDLYGEAVALPCWHDDEYADLVMASYTTVKFDGTEYHGDGAR